MSGAAAGLPDGWCETTLGQVCSRGRGTIQTGPFGSQLHAHDYVEAGTPVVMPVNIGDNRIVETGIARVSEHDADRLRRHALRAGDIVYSRRGDVERRALVRAHEVGWICGTGCLLVRVDPAVADPPFVSHYLGGPVARAWIVQHAIGATMPNLNTGILADVPLVLPPRPEQRAIAGILGSLDDKIESNRRISASCLDLLDVLSSAFEGPVAALGTLAEATRDLIDPAATDHGQLEHFSIPAFDAGGLPEIVAPSSIKSSKFAVDRPAVLVSRLNPATPRVWFAVPMSGTGLASTEFLVLRGREGVSLGAVWLAVRSEPFLDELRRRATGTSGSHQRVRPADAMSIEVPDARAASARITEEADALLALVQQARTQSRTLAALRDALLPELLAGRIRLADAREQVEAAV